MFTYADNALFFRIFSVFEGNLYTMIWWISIVQSNKTNVTAYKFFE